MQGLATTHVSSTKVKGSNCRRSGSYLPYAEISHTSQWKGCFKTAATIPRSVGPCRARHPHQTREHRTKHTPEQRAYCAATILQTSTAKFCVDDAKKITPRQHACRHQFSIELSAHPARHVTSSLHYVPHAHILRHARVAPSTMYQLPSPLAALSNLLSSVHVKRAFRAYHTLRTALVALRSAALMLASSASVRATFTKMMSEAGGRTQSRLE